MFCYVLMGGSVPSILGFAYDSDCVFDYFILISGTGGVLIFLAFGVLIVHKRPGSFSAMIP